MIALLDEYKTQLSEVCGYVDRRLKTMLPVWVCLPGI